MNDPPKMVHRSTDIETYGKNISIRADEIEKIIKKSHSDERKERDRGQRVVTAKDILNAVKVICEADNIINGGMYENKPCIKFEKYIDGKNTVVTFVSNKHNDIGIQKVYIGAKK